MCPEKTENYFTDLRADIDAKVMPESEATTLRILKGQIHSGLPGRTKTQLIGIMERVFKGEEIVFVQPNMINVDYVFRMAMDLFAVVGAERSKQCDYQIDFGDGRMRVAAASQRPEPMVASTNFLIEFDHDWRGIHGLPDYCITTWLETAGMQQKKLEITKGDPS